MSQNFTNHFAQTVSPGFRIEILQGVTLATWCLRYPNTVSFLRNKTAYYLSKPLEPPII